MRDVDTRWRTGALLVGLSLLAGLAMQAVADQWFPPPISVSQYGIGPWGWLFSVCVVAMAAAPLVLRGPDRPRRARILLWIGLAGALVMAIVRTDTTGNQTSPNSRVHTVGAVLFLVMLPMGTAAVLRLRGGWVGRLAAWQLVLVEGAGVLLLAAAFGLDTAGLGPARSWAFWQAVASVGCWLMVLTLIVVSRPSRRAVDGVREDHTDAPGQAVQPPSILVQEAPVATRALHENH